MTEPDEALKAFRKWARIRFPKCGTDIEAGKWDRDDTAHAYRAGAAASAERIKALEARVEELEVALAKANEPHWFYSADNAAPEHSLEDAIEGAIYDITTFGDHLLEIETARPCSTIWGVVRILTKDEAAARGCKDEWVFTLCANEAQARALLKETDQ